MLASNIDQTAARRLRTEIRARRKAGPALTTASVTQLRGPDGFDREHGLPFPQWPARRAKVAVGRVPDGGHGDR